MPALCLPKKLFSSAVARAVCESVDPIMPKRKGLTPSSPKRLRPSLSAPRAYSNSSMSLVLGTPAKLPSSQLS